MAHTRSVTQIFRMNRYVTSTFALLNLAREDFGTAVGTVRLARLLDIPDARAKELVDGMAVPGMNRLAFQYGFMPCDDSQNAWRALPMSEQPFDDGPAVRWDNGTIDYVHEVLTIRSELRPSARHLAWRMDTTERRLRDALRRRGLKLSA